MLKIEKGKTDVKKFQIFLSYVKRQFKLRLVWKLRSYILMQKIGKSFALLYASILICLLGVLVWVFNKFVVSFLDYIKDPAIATLIGAIVGALVGGIFAYMAAFDVHKGQLEATAALKRRDEIYRPLYNNLTSLREKVIRDPNDLSSVLSNKDLHIHLEQSQFWLSLPQDIKQLQIPINLVKAMTDLKKLVESCSKAQNEVLEDTAFKAPNAKRLNLVLKFADSFQTNKKDSIEALSELIKVKLEIESLDSFKQFEKSYKELELALEDLVLYSEEIIKFINNRYEQKANWY